jgi:HlyD family secretion protein
MKMRDLFRSKIFLLIVAVALCGLGYLYWDANVRETAQQRYRTQEAAVGDVTRTVSANGTLNPVVLVNVGTQVSGTVRKLHVDFNDHVRAGQVLLELDPALYAAQVNQSEASVHNIEASLELARANADRSRVLFDQQFISRQEFDTSVQALKSATAQLELARAQLAKDRTNLSYATIRSPVSGVVVDRAVDVGQTVAASFQTPTLFKIAQDLAKMQIDSSFAEADVGSIRVGQPVRFTVDAYPSRSFNAKVRQIRLNATTQQNVVTYDVVVGVDNPEQILMPGMTAYVNVIVAQSKDVLLVPNAALRYRPAQMQAQDKAAPARGKRDKEEAPTGRVFVIDGEKLRAVSIKTGISDNRFTEVTSAELKAGDRVVTGEVEAADGGQTPSTMRMRLF